MGNIKRSGIIRRIDDLGRIVIPRELRTKLKTHEGDAFEICIIDIDGQQAFCAIPYLHDMNSRTKRDIAEAIIQAIDDDVLVVIGSEISETKLYPSDPSAYDYRLVTAVEMHVRDLIRRDPANRPYQDVVQDMKEYHMVTSMTVQDVYEKNTLFAIFSKQELTEKQQNAFGAIINMAKNFIQ